ncbi:glutathione S-transferase N-terminal domain-containing protein [Asticcacaulis sp. EMRT-3]|uniref:glutathione S-transferase family protein n=1 Tax=Asticcacaulis sp. EMRT-3 TaxID=3040349 RepID=UPI0024AEB711|nr:glutathione S-transferase N-terminal domain-containing protein [Asticcacaulis sp. EMRT-3]MDI7776198.1 glutathione S-transferase N-terminal domain-containing protein [Asticcacaulis sp. EMRT-3]
MIHLYAWGTPNGRKAYIMLEELGIPYENHPVNIGKDEQFAPDFLKISPNNKIPAIIDDETDLSLFESGAILIYLAETYGRFLPPGKERHTVIQWLMWQVGGLGPMMGQLGFFALQDEPNTPAIERFTKEVGRLFNVLEKQLGAHVYVAGDDYSIADIAIYPWLAQFRVRVKDVIEPMLQSRPHILAWLDKVGARTGVQRGMQLP